MKIPTKTMTQDAESFVKAANNGNPVVETAKPRKSSNINTSLSFTPRQYQCLNDILATSGLYGITHLFHTAVAFAEDHPFEEKDFSNHIGLLTDKGKDTTKIMYRKQGSYEAFKSKSDYFKATWINMPIKGVALMYLLNYAKKKLNMDISKYS